MSFYLYVLQKIEDFNKPRFSFGGLRRTLHVRRDLEKAQYWLESVGVPHMPKLSLWDRHEERRLTREEERERCLTKQ